MKKLFFIITYLCLQITFGQQGIKINLDSLQQEYNQAKSSGNIETEISSLFEIFKLNRDEIANYSLAYELGIELEALLIRNKNLNVSRKVAPFFYNKMAWLYHSQSRYKKSIEYYYIALEYAKKQGLDELAFDIKTSIIFNLHLSKQEDESHKLIDSLMQIATKEKNKKQLSKLHYTYYTLNIEDADPNEALKHVKKSFFNLTPRDSSHRYINLGTCYSRLKVNDSALFYTFKGLEIAKKYNFIQQQSNAHSQLKAIYLEIEDFEKAMLHTIEFEKLGLQLGSQTTAIRIEDESKKEMEKRIQLQKALSNQKFKTQRIIIYASILAVLFLITFVIVLINRVKLIRTQKEIIENEKQRAEQSEKYKEQFLANMSHEIRTPMHAISGMTNNLLRNPHPKEQKPYLESMKTSSDNLLILLDDILDLSKIESGKLEFEQVLMKPRTIINNVVKVLRYRAEDKGLELTSTIDYDVPEYIIGDSIRLNQILINLVGNSIKFTEQGSINISCSLKTPDTILFCVSDTGIGITIEKMKTIFDSFEQGEKSKSQIFKGTGLGLSISKKLIELQNGKIWAESKKGEGSQFYFSLPLISNASNNIKKAIITESDLSETADKLANIKILLVEDDDFNIMVIEDDLKYFIKKFSLTVAKNGEEALEIFKSNTFDIVLMDLHMPIMNGIEATEKIREFEKQNSKNYKTPILAMTANIVKSELDKCILAGMNDYIPKPYKAEHLLKKLQEYYIKKPH